MLPDDVDHIRQQRRRFMIPILGMSIMELVFLVGLVLFVRTFVFQLFRVSGPSMCPTLNQIDNACEYGGGELIFVDQFSYSFLDEPKRDEIVVFRSPVERIFVIKRIIGQPGDTVKIAAGNVTVTDADGRIVLDDEPYLGPDDRGATRTYGINEWTVPEGHYFLMGDNRDKSQDGRHCYRSERCPTDAGNGPFVEQSLIKGKARWVLFPFDLVRDLS